MRRRPAGHRRASPPYRRNCGFMSYIMIRVTQSVYSSTGCESIKSRTQSFNLADTHLIQIRAFLLTTAVPHYNTSKPATLHPQQGNSPASAVSGSIIISSCHGRSPPEFVWPSPSKNGGRHFLSFTPPTCIKDKADIYSSCSSLLTSLITHSHGQRNKGQSCSRCPFAKLRL